jgi:hypothetical protein
MELLIPGLILVALMAYVSTRIKRSAVRAFEPEAIHGDGFSITKPEGFLHLSEENTEYAFEAYSKEFGQGAADNVRAAHAIVIVGDADLGETAAIERSRLSNVDETEAFELGEAHCMILKGELLREGHKFQVSTKILRQAGRTFTLRIEVLEEPASDFARRIDEMILSFRPN